MPVVGGLASPVSVSIPGTPAARAAWTSTSGTQTIPPSALGAEARGQPFPVTPGPRTSHRPPPTGTHVWVFVLRFSDTGVEASAAASALAWSVIARLAAEIGRAHV